MKKKLCLMLAVMLLLLSACGGKKAPETMAQEPSTAATESTPVETTAEPTQPETTAPAPAPVNEPEAEGVPIDFRMIYRGFTAVSLDDTENYERFCGYGTKMIASEEEWNSFMAAYCPGIPYYETWDFSQDVLVTSVSHGAKPGYNQADVITSVKWNGSYVVTEYSNDPANFVYALNSMSDEVMMNFYIEVIAVSRKDVGM